MHTTEPWFGGELLAFDFETTGVDPFVDVPVSFALVRMIGGQIEEPLSSLVDPGRPIPAGAIAVHGITDERAMELGMTMKGAVVLVAEAILDASRRGVPIVGMKLDFDLTMLDACCRRIGGWGLHDAGFAGPVLDALVLDRHLDRYRPGRRTLGDLCSHYGVVIEHAHDAVADAKATLDVLEAMCRRFPDLCAARPHDLYWSQMDWHREWAESFSQWLQRKGMRALDESSATWPISRVGVGGARRAAG